MSVPWNLPIVCTFVFVREPLLPQIYLYTNTLKHTYLTRIFFLLLFKAALITGHHSEWRLMQWSASGCWPWRCCATYGRDVDGYCYPRFRNLCRPPWMNNSSVGRNICWVVNLVLSGHFKQIVFAFGLTLSITSITSCLKEWEPKYLELNQ